MIIGGLHIEMAALKSMGSLLQHSGWTSALDEERVASCGTAEFCLSATGITRGRQARHITACCLYKQRKAAYNSYCRVKVNKAFMFSKSGLRNKVHILGFVLALGLAILTLIYSFREADFCLYREALAELSPYFFANSNVNYALRWLSIGFHLGDMVTIDQQHPEVGRESFKGHFGLHKSCEEFSLIAIDQAHEQNNAFIKDDGGVIGLT